MPKACLRLANPAAVSEAVSDWAILAVHLGPPLSILSRNKEQHHPSTHHPRPPVSSCVRWSLSTELPPLSLIRRSGRFSLRPRAAGQLGNVGRLQKMRFYMIANT